MSYALGQGWRVALPMAVGVALGDFTAMTLSMPFLLYTSDPADELTVVDPCGRRSIYKNTQYNYFD